MARDTNEILGIHHVTALCGPAGRNLWFYTRVLGLRLVKKTVNFDDPRSYHFYFGDRTGRPGTLITFFPHPAMRPGKPGAREVAATHLAVPAGALGYWSDRLHRAGLMLERKPAGGGERVEFRDPDGTRLSVAEGERPVLDAAAPESDVPAEYAITGIAGVTAVVNALAPTAKFLTETLCFEQSNDDARRASFRPRGSQTGQWIEVVMDEMAPPATLGVGSVHHVAWRVPDDAARDRVRATVAPKVAHVTPTRDRGYFRSIYFREPGGVLFEVATDVPGFLIDEDEASLGMALKLPPQFEADRANIEAALPPLEV